MLKAVLFDLDGTLLPMNEQEFTKYYFGLLANYMKSAGYDKEELVKCVWGGTRVMLKNDGEKTNEQLFWEYFASFYGSEKLNDKPKFDEFYRTEFLKTKAFCGYNPNARDIVAFAKQNGLKTVLASNPIFPKDGMLSRASFTGLTANLFDFVTSYENSRFCKPNPGYLTDVLNALGVTTEEVIYFGNSVPDDFIPAKKCGIKCFLTGDVVLPENSSPSDYSDCFSEDIKQTIENEIKK